MTAVTKTAPPIRIKRLGRTDPGKPPQSPPVVPPPPEPTPQVKAPKTPPKPAWPSYPGLAPVAEVPVPVVPAAATTSRLESRAGSSSTTKDVSAGSSNVSNVVPTGSSNTSSVVPKPKPKVKSRSSHRWSKPGRNGFQIWESGNRDILKAETPTHQPDGKLVLYGRLRLFYLPQHDRPCLVLEVEGEPPRWFGWRFDWEVSTDTACLIELAPGKSAWIKLQPRTMSEHQDVWLTGKIALESWRETRKQRKATTKRDHNLDTMIEMTRSLP